MGASCSVSSGCAGDSLACDGRSVQKYQNCKVSGRGGPMEALQGRVVCMVVAFDYEGYPAEEKAHLGPLSCVKDGRRFAGLARSAGAEVLEFYDQSDVTCLGFPQKDRILDEMKLLGQSLGSQDTFVFFYAGHGTQIKDKDGDEKDGKDEALCFVEPDGTPNFLVDDDIAALLISTFAPNTHILFVTDSCHGGTVCDLTRSTLCRRPICHLSAVRDSQCADDLGDGGAFTCALLETMEKLVQEGETELSIVQVFNTCYGKFDSYQETQDFAFEFTSDFDPDTFAWPLVPQPGWKVDTLLDHEIKMGNHVLKVPFTVSHREGPSSQNGTYVLLPIDPAGGVERNYTMTPYVLKPPFVAAHVQKPVQQPAAPRRPQKFGGA